MGTIGYGYGSEWHLMRYLARHRHCLNDQIREQAGLQVIDWLDFPCGSRSQLFLAEHKGVDFLGGALKQEWYAFWPQTGNAQNWDAVGLTVNGQQMEYLLVEAKAHVGELQSKCGAKSKRSCATIARALEEAKTLFGSCPEADWMSPYYQYCNRLATLSFLKQKGVPARLLFVYFTGESMNGCICPSSSEEWEPILEEMYRLIGVPWSTQNALGVHKVFLPASGP